LARNLRGRIHSAEGGPGYSMVGSRPRAGRRPLAGVDGEPAPTRRGRLAAGTVADGVIVSSGAGPRRSGEGLDIAPRAQIRSIGVGRGPEGSRSVSGGHAWSGGCGGVDMLSWKFACARDTSEATAGRIGCCRGAECGFVLGGQCAGIGGAAGHGQLWLAWSAPVHGARQGHEFADHGARGGRRSWERPR